VAAKGIEMSLMQAHPDSLPPGHPAGDPARLPLQPADGAVTARFAGTPAQASVHAELTEVAERLRRSTVLVLGSAGRRGRAGGAGSGIVWRADRIVTAAHVVDGRRVEVELWDGRRLEAQVLDVDAEQDLASLAVQAPELPVAPIGDSDALRSGELLLASGHPLGLSRAVSLGVVHAVERGASVAGGAGWIWADIRLAPGNSGGPLADARGRVVGVNSRIAWGAALAVPSGSVNRFLQRSGQRPFLGVDLRPVPAVLDGRQALGLLVVDVAPGGPAEDAGILIGDLLVRAAGRPFTAAQDLRRVVQRSAPGQRLQLDLLRAGSALTLEVSLRGQPPLAEAA
jgi:serine protease Do